MSHVINLPEDDSHEMTSHIFPEILQLKNLCPLLQSCFVLCFDCLLSTVSSLIFKQVYLIRCRAHPAISHYSHVLLKMFCFCLI